MRLRLLIASMSSVSGAVSALLIWGHWKSPVFYRNRTVYAGIVCQNVTLKFGTI